MKKLLFVVLLIPVFSLAQSRFIRVVNSIAELQASNPAQIHTNVFVVGPANSGVYSYLAGATNHATLPFYPTTYAGATGVYVHIITPTAVGITNINSVSSVNWTAGTNIVFTTNAYGNVTIASTASGSGGSGTNFGWQLIGSGVDYPLTNDYSHVVFGGVTSSDIILTNAGTYQIILTVGAFANNSFPQHYYLTNITDNTSVPGSQHDINVLSLEAPLVIAVQYTTTGDNKTLQLWGYTDDSTYSGLPNVLAERTVANILVVTTTAFSSSGVQVFSGNYGGGLPIDVPTTSAAIAYDLDAPGTLYLWDSTIWY